MDNLREDFPFIKNHPNLAYFDNAATSLKPRVVIDEVTYYYENIGANIGLLPLTGIPLPFISKGGSSILGNMIAIGLILSMRFQAGASKNNE